MSIDTELAIAGVALGVVAFLFAIVTTNDKARLERLIEAKLWGFCTSLERIRGNPKLAHRHLDELRRFLNRLPHSSELQVPLDQVAWAQGDSVAAVRLLDELREDIDTVRVGLFPRQAKNREVKQRKAES